MAFRAGTVALAGRPNVGKSTIVNAIVGQKVSIVSDKPQTTRRRVMGVHTTEAYQMVFIDTPGVFETHSALGRAMMESVRSALHDADVILAVVDASRHPGKLDEAVADTMRQSAQRPPVVLCLNKMDLWKAENVESHTELYQELFGTSESMPTTATRKFNLGKLEGLLAAHLPEGEPLFDEDEFTDQSSRFLVGEYVRECILRATRQEVPHATAVMVDQWERQPNDVTHIAATILVDKSSQRAIILGKGGAFIKSVGTQARQEIEALIGGPVYLELHVKVSENWRMNPSILRELEYQD